MSQQIPEQGRAGIAIDAWKLPIFRRRLDAAGASYSEGPGLSPGTIAIYVEYAPGAALDLAGLTRLVKAAQLECAGAREQ